MVRVQLVDFETLLQLKKIIITSFLAPIVVAYFLVEHMAHYRLFRQPL